MGTAFGAVQGAISTRFRLEPFIVTLAGLQAARGLALVVSGNQYINISYGDGPGLAPPVFAVLGERLFNNVVPVATIVFIVFAAIATIVLNTTRFGRYVFAVGGNERAARTLRRPGLAGQDLASMPSPALPSALAGIVHAGQFNFGSANDGTGYELTAIAAVVIGGTSLFGGSGSMVGTVAGTIMLGALANMLQLNNITPALQLLATAAIIVLAAVLQSLVRRREGLSRWMKRHRKSSQTKVVEPGPTRRRVDMKTMRCIERTCLAGRAAGRRLPVPSPAPPRLPTRWSRPARRTASSSSASRRPTTPSPIASTSMTS